MKQEAREVIVSMSEHRRESKKCGRFSPNSCSTVAARLQHGLLSRYFSNQQVYTPTMILIFVGPEHPTVWGRRRGLTINTAAGGSNPPRGARGAGRRWAAPGAAASRGRCPGSTGGRCAQASRRAGRWRPGVITRERGAYRTAEAGTRNQYVQYVGPWAQAALRLLYVHNAGGRYA